MPALAEAYKNEPRRDIRASIIAALGKIRDRSAIPALTEALLTDFQKDVRLQAIDSLLRLYIPIADDGGFWTFITDVRRIFTEEEQFRVAANEYVDQTTKEALVEATPNGLRLGSPGGNSQCFGVSPCRGPAPGVDRGTGRAATPGRLGSSDSDDPKHGYSR